MLSCLVAFKREAKLKLENKSALLAEFMRENIDLSYSFKISA
jgi:hypothetical protein